MAQITCKELSALSDLMGIEENMIAKYHAAACITNDSVLKNEYEQMAQRHQRHFDELYSNLK